MGVSILRGGDDGVVAGIGCREGPKLKTIAVSPGAAGSGLKEQTYRRGGCRSRKNLSQLVGADGAMTPELVVVGRKRAPRSW